MPIAEGEGDLCAFLIGANVFGGLGEVVMQEIEDFRQAGGLGRRQLLRQRRQRVLADVKLALTDRDFVFDIEIKVTVGRQL